ncbi:MAG TPA: hypothetical protein VIL49_16030 [Capillimicrobium sp.]
MAALILGLAGAALLALTEVTTVIEIRARAVVLETQTGADRHSWALLVLGVAALPLTWAAAVLRSRPAMIALAAIGLVALLFWAVGDLPDSDETGAYGIRYEDASAAAGSGLWLELLGGAALLAAALACLGAAGRARALERSAAREERRRKRDEPSVHV